MFEARKCKTPRLEGIYQVYNPRFEVRNQRFYKKMKFWKDGNYQTLKFFSDFCLAKQKLFELSFLGPEEQKFWKTENVSLENNGGSQKSLVFCY